MAIHTLIHFFILHFLFDWKFQNNWMALGKSTKPLNLFVHCLVATAWCVAWGWKFWLMNFVLHAITDQTTSQWTSRLWFIKTVPAGHAWRKLDESNASKEPCYWVDFDDERRHWFFVAIGFDQCIHYCTLILTYVWLVQHGL